jgi:hypothetical protein
MRVEGKEFLISGILIDKAGQEKMLRPPFMKTTSLVLCSLAAVLFVGPTAAAPVINTPPKNTTIYRADTARFDVSATGLEPLSYQWSKGANSIPNATSSTLLLPNIRPIDAGQYRVRITDGAGASTTSALVNLTVIDPTAQTSILTAVETASICSSGANPQGAATMLVGTRRSGIMDRGLLRFDVSVLPTNGQITSAKLHMTIVKAPSNYAEGTSLVIHRMLRPWNSAASWSMSGLGESWQSDGGAPGADFASTLSATALISGVAEYEVGSTPEMTADVQGWQLDPASNFGWLFKSDSEETPKSARHYGVPASSNPPHLFVGYLLPPTQPQLAASRRQGTNLVFQISPAAGRLYHIEYRGEADSGDWLPLTNAPSGNGLSQILINAPIVATNRFLRATVE